MPICIHGKIHYGMSRGNESMDVQQTNLSGRKILLFSSFGIHEKEMFYLVDEARH